MKKSINIQKQSFVFWLFGLLLLVSPLMASAIGQTTDPIVIDNALRGGEFQKTMIVVNNDNENVEVKLSAEGQIAGWTKFYLPSDLKNPIQEFSLEKDVQANIVVVFTVPKDTANGDYTGFVGAGRKIGASTASKDESSVSVEQKINRDVTIKVTDKEVVKLLVSVIPEKYDVKSGENLSVRFIYDNQSNVAMSPQIQFRIKQNDKTVYNAIFPYPDGEDLVRPLAQHEIPALKIPTSGLASGRYIAEMDFFHNGKSVATQDFKFTVGSGSVLGAFEISSIGYWIIAPIVLVIAAILLGLFLIIRMKKKNTISGEIV